MPATEPVEEDNPVPLALTLASRQALARELSMEPDASAILERHASLEEGLAALVDGGHLDPAFRLLARMLSPAKSMLWAVLSHDVINQGDRAGDMMCEKARKALLDFALKPVTDTKAKAEVTGQALGGTHPLGLAASALSLLVDGKASLQAENSLPENCLFADLVGRSIWLMALGTAGDERKRATMAKVLAAKGVSLSLHRKP